MTKKLRTEIIVRINQSLYLLSTGDELVKETSSQLQIHV